METKYVFASDIFLCSGVEGVEPQDSILCNLLKSSSELAFNHLVQSCVEHRVQALVLMDHLFDNALFGSLVIPKLHDAFDRLRSSNTKVVIAASETAHILRSFFEKRSNVVILEESHSHALSEEISLTRRVNPGSSPENGVSLLLRRTGKNARKQDIAIESGSHSSQRFDAHGRLSLQVAPMHYTKFPRPYGIARSSLLAFKNEAVQRTELTHGILAFATSLVCVETGNSDGLMKYIQEALEEIVESASLPTVVRLVLDLTDLSDAPDLGVPPLGSAFTKSCRDQLSRMQALVPIWLDEVSLTGQGAPRRHVTPNSKLQLDAESLDEAFRRGTAMFTRYVSPFYRSNDQ